MPTTPVSLLPDDEFNRQLAANVHPPEWENPTPDGRYNMVVIGAGRRRSFRPGEILSGPDRSFRPGEILSGPERPGCAR